MTTPIVPDSTPQPTTDSYTIHDWVQVLQNAAKVPLGHPRYAEAQAAIHGVPGSGVLGAKDQINLMLQQQQASDQQADATPNKWLGRVVTFGNAAGLGLPGKLFSQTKDYVSRERAADPVGSTVADVAGSAADMALGGAALKGLGLAANVSPAVQGTLLGGGVGAARGGVEGGGAGALVGGVTGAAGGYVGGKIAGALAPLATNVRTAVVRALAKMGVGGAKGITREMLLSAGVAPENVEAQLARIRAGGPVGTYEPPPVRTGSSGVQTTLPPKAPLDEAAARAAGVPPPPNVMARIGNETPGKVTLDEFMQGKGAGGTQAGQLATDYRDALRATTQALGRPMTSAERDLVLQHVMGTGKTLPYYSRGGSAVQALTEQAMPPGPQTSGPNWATSGEGMNTPQALELSRQLAALLGQH